MEAGGRGQKHQCQYPHSDCLKKYRSIDYLPAPLDPCSKATFHQRGDNCVTVARMITCFSFNAVQCQSTVEALRYFHLYSIPKP